MSATKNEVPIAIAIITKLKITVKKLTCVTIK